MRHGIVVVLSSIAISSLPMAARADEGMWTPWQLRELSRELEAAGLQLEPAALTRDTDSPLGAVVRLGGCTTSFVSPQGLMITNYHCVLSSVQHHSRPERNLLHEGFLAKQPSEELPAAPGSRGLITVDARNVTAQIVDAATMKLTGQQRLAAQAANEKRIIADCEQGGGYYCRIYAYHGGLEFHLIKQLEIRDLRLVYAPPNGVGMFGGETDNWMWPRHTGDFAFYRGYVGKDGKPAEYSPENVPYRPPRYLPIAQTGVNEGDFVMAAGYPTLTNRYRLPIEIEATFAWNYPALNEAASEQLSIIAEQTRDRAAAELAYVSRVSSINNGLKKRHGLLRAYARGDVLAKERVKFEELKQWVRADGSRNRLYGADLGALEELLSRRAALDRREFLMDYVQPRFLITARGLYRLATERAKTDDMAREPGFQDRDLPDIKAALNAINKRYDEQVDKALVHRFLMRYLALPEQEQNLAFNAALGLRQKMSEAEVRARLDRIYAGTELADPAKRIAWMERGVRDFNVSGDTLIRAAVALYRDDLRREARDKESDGRIQRAYANYMKALIAYRSARREPVYPDANGTLRVTFGHVAGPANAGREASAFTTLDGILAKHRGDGDFDAPAAQLSAIRAGKFGAFSAPSLHSVPVNYLTELDITGGNSGSPVMNGRGELVGLVFDGTLDSVISDWAFDPVNTRTIVVDMRYVMWQMQFVDGAGTLLTEMRASGLSSSVN